jgi:hypothetical protein
MYTDLRRQSRTTATLYRSAPSSGLGSVCVRQNHTCHKNITGDGVSCIRYRDLAGSLRDMPRPRKGDRVELLTRPERLVSEKIKQQAAARGMSVSQYVADLLAIQAGHPELVRELDKEVLPLAM